MSVSDYDGILPHGWKLVLPDYTSLHGGKQVYTPGTTQQICESAVFNDFKKRPVLCTNTALHFCDNAVDTLMHAKGFDVSTLILLRVTAVPTPFAADSGAFFTRGSVGGAAVCGAVALRVDAEIVDADERARRLTGTTVTVLDQLMARQLTIECDYVNGTLTAERTTDAAGNVVRTKDAASGRSSFGHYILADVLRRDDDGSINTYKNLRNFIKVSNFVMDINVTADGVRLNDDMEVLFVTGGALLGRDKTCEVASSFTVRELRERVPTACRGYTAAVRRAEREGDHVNRRQLEAARRHSLDACKRVGQNV